MNLVHSFKSNLSFLTFLGLWLSFHLLISVPTPGREALNKKVHPSRPAGCWPCRGARQQSARRTWVAARRDRPIRRSLALCSFRPLTRRRCGRRGGSRGCSGPGRLDWLLTLVAMEWGSEWGAVRRHRIGGERRDGPAAAPQLEREALAQEPLADACGGGARTRKRSGEGSGSASRGAGTGLSEVRASLGLALYLLALRALVQLSLQQLMVRGAAVGHRGEFDARRARYRRLRRARVSLFGAGPRTCVHLPPRGLPGSPPPPGCTWGGVAWRVPLLEPQFAGRGARAAPF